MSIFDSDYKKGHDQGVADKERIENEGYTVGDALNDITSEAIGWINPEHTKGYNDGRSKD